MKQTIIIALFFTLLINKAEAGIDFFLLNMDTVTVHAPAGRMVNVFFSTSNIGWPMLMLTSTRSGMNDLMEANDTTGHGWNHQFLGGVDTLRLTVYDQDGNILDQVTRYIVEETPTGISETKSSTFKIFPNPATNSITIDAPATIVNMSGQEVRRFDSNGTFPIGDLPNGSYVATSGNNRQLLVKQ